MDKIPLIHVEVSYNKKEIDYYDEIETIDSKGWNIDNINWCFTNVYNYKL